jgi:hypothetical protein
MRELPCKNGPQGAVFSVEEMIHRIIADLVPPTLTLLLTKQALRKGLLLSRCRQRRQLFLEAIFVKPKLYNTQQ